MTNIGQSHPSVASTRNTEAALVCRPCNHVPLTAWTVANDGTRLLASPVVGWQTDPETGDMRALIVDPDLGVSPAPVGYDHVVLAADADPREYADLHLEILMRRWRDWARENKVAGRVIEAGTGATLAALGIGLADLETSRDSFAALGYEVDVSDGVLSVTTSGDVEPGPVTRARALLAGGSTW